MNNFNCVATCVRDAEVRFSQSGMAILSVKVANNIGFGDKQKTNWIDIVMFGKIAESWLKDSLKKGVKIVANGPLVIELSNGKDGKQYLNSTLTVKNFDSIHVCSDKKQESKSEPKVKDNFDDFNDEIGF